MGSRCVKFGVISITLSYWSLEVQHGTSWQRTLWGFEKRIVALHKDDIGYKKFAKTLKLSCSTVAKTTQWFNRTGSTQNRPRHGWPKKLSARAQHHIQRLCLGIDVWVLPALQQRLKGWGGQPVSAQYGCRSRRKPLLKMMHNKACKQFAEDKQAKDIDYWNHVLWSDETKINLFGSDGVKRVWRQPGEEVQRQVCLAYCQAWWCEFHDLGLHECCRHWGATVHWGNYECQHILWHTEAEHDPLPSETGSQGSIPIW